ncbi:bone morphogenetic protein 2-like [Thalassophryne amazonica]|uniref:bone morphogenetic protein 2-like n=1 Tax=Thalassophryne amazonica TaxID=390379 RepID=UPI001471594A|nr:bone morphogenetic protein 2-like [Thalassophryne amazonica]
MTPRLLCVWLVFAVPLVTVHGRSAERKRGALEALLRAHDLPRGPAAAPSRKPPQFMVDLFNAVTSSGQKQILEGNIVRSFEERVVSESSLLPGTELAFFTSLSRHLLFLSSCLPNIQQHHADSLIKMSRHHLSVLRKKRQLCRASVSAERKRGALEALLRAHDLPRGPAAAPSRKPPQFMVDLFNAVTSSGQKQILEGNIVRSFEERGQGGERFHLFKLSTFGREERMMKAEFRWFRTKQMFDFRSSYGPHFYKVDLYEVLDTREQPLRGNLITSRQVPVHTQGWEVFNVTQMVSKWLLRGQENSSILVATTLPTGNRTESVHKEWTEKVTYLVLFSDNGRAGGASNTSHPGQTQSAATIHTRSSRGRRAAPAFSPYSQRQSCQRVPLIVNFEEIGWSGWIISPRGYNAYHCKGSCPFPLGGNLRPTNHATVRSIMHALKLMTEDVGAPCCVPDRLHSISLLYFDEEENVVLKQYEDMVALSCGCH